MQSKYFSSKKRSNPNESKVINPSSVPVDNICPICLDCCSDITTIDGCKHLFCFTCITSWAKITNKCPLCKTQILKCATINCLPSKTFEPDLQPQNDEEINGDQSHAEDEYEDSISTSGYESDDGFIVDDWNLEHDELEDETENDRILDEADRTLLPRKRRKIYDSVREREGSSSDDHSYSYSSTNSSSNSGLTEDINSFLKSCELIQ
jgi:hypothetical protein